MRIYTVIQDGVEKATIAPAGIENVVVDLDELELIVWRTRGEDGIRCLLEALEFPSPDAFDLNTPTGKADALIEIAGALQEVAGEFGCDASEVDWDAFHEAMAARAGRPA